jgi:hypothetical protein
MFDPNPVRHRCRNPRCKVQLKEPVANPRDAFCCVGCEAGFYRTHCRVCEKALGETKRNWRRELCGRRQCRNQFRSFRNGLFSVWYPSAIGASKPEKSSTKSTLKTGIKSDQALRLSSCTDAPEEVVSALAAVGFAIGGAYDREVLRKNFKDNAKFWNAAALIGPNDPPVNILGGYKFPNAPVVDLSWIPPKTSGQWWVFELTNDATDIALAWINAEQNKQIDQERGVR